MSTFASARIAADRGDWAGALELLAGDESPDAAEIAARARYGNGEFEAAVATRWWR